jgi:hypothetical protein
VKLPELPARTVRCCVAPTQHTDNLLAPRRVLEEAIDDEFGAPYRMHSMNVTGGKSMNLDQYCES